MHIHKKEVIDYVGGLADLEAGEIHMIGDATKRFIEDPVRMIRAVRFSEKLNAKMSEEIKTAILKQASLLGNVSAVRLYEECIKLFQNEYSFKVYEQLERYGLLRHLFKQTHKNDFIKKACNNTSERIKNGKPVTPAFLFAVFLWQAQNERFALIKKKQHSFHLTQAQACDEAIIRQIKQVSMPRYLTAKIN
jgi:poly(A) polymerase